MLKVGKVRRFLLINGSWKWNGFVRDFTVKLEMIGLLRHGG